MSFFRVSSPVALAPLLVCLVTGCAYNANIRERAQFLQTGAVEQTPVVAPTKSVSSLRDGLTCMDRMLREEQVPTTLIAVKSIPDASGLYSTSTKDMLITALSRMSRTSYAFRIVDYEVDPLRQDTVQNMTSLLLNNGLLNLQKPEIYISGSISFGDKTVISKRRSIGISTENTDTGWSYDVLGSMIGLELHLGDMNTRTLFPGLDSANEVVIASGGRSFELGGRATGLPTRIYRVGAQFEISADVNQGAGAAVRALADLAAIELVGKWTHVPYWQCIAYEQNHPEFLRQLREWYDELPAIDRTMTVQRALRTAGYWSGEADGRLTPDLRHAVMRYQSDQDLVASGAITFETYERLMRSYVVADEAGNFQRVGWGDTTGGSEGLARRDTPPPGEPGHPAPISMQLADRRTSITVGDPIALRIVPSQGGHLYCYYQDASHVVTQIYPNPMQRAADVQANRAVVVPDTLNPNAFAIEATKPGLEEVFCASTRTNAADKLPAKYVGANLEPLTGVADLREIKAIFAALPASQGVTTGGYQWIVKKHP